MKQEEAIAMSFKSTSDAIFDPKDRVAPLGIIAMRGTEELAAKIDHYMVEWSKKGGGQEQKTAADFQAPPPDHYSVSM